MLEPKVLTPEQISKLLQLSKNTVYELINRGEIVAKRIGKVYRIPATSVFFAFSGLDYDLYQADEKDRNNLSEIKKGVAKARRSL